MARATGRAFHRMAAVGAAGNHGLAHLAAFLLERATGAANLGSRLALGLHRVILCFARRVADSLLRIREGRERKYQRDRSNNFPHALSFELTPRRAASILAMSIFFIVNISSNTRLATAGSGSVTPLIRTAGVICQFRPHLSLHQPHALSAPPLPTIAFQ